MARGFGCFWSTRQARAGGRPGALSRGVCRFRTSAAAGPFACANANVRTRELTRVPAAPPPRARRENCAFARAARLLLLLRCVRARGARTSCFRAAGPLSPFFSAGARGRREGRGAGLQDAGRIERPWRRARALVRALPSAHHVLPRARAAGRPALPAARHRARLPARRLLPARCVRGGDLLALLCFARLHPAPRGALPLALFRASPRRAPARSRGAHELDRAAESSFPCTPIPPAPPPLFPSPIEVRCA